MGCGPCSIVHHVAAFVQIVLACTIIGLVAVKLQSITVNTADIIDVTFTNFCLLGADYGSTSLCNYTYAVCGISLVVSLCISLVQCCTCNLCGLGNILDVLLGAFGTVWWAIASGVIYANSKKALSPEAQLILDKSGASSYRDAVPILCWVETGLFVLLLITSIFKCFKFCM